MKLLMVGAGSPVGKELIKLLKQRKIEFFAPEPEEIDPRDEVNVARVITRYEPDQVINLASFAAGRQSAVAEAEEVPERCEAINLDQTSVIAQVCDHLNVPLIHLSSAYVFNGEKKLAYNEQDSADPIGVYGATELEGEEAIIRSMDKYVIIRSGWLFGQWQDGAIRSWIDEAKASDGKLTLLRRKFSPTSTDDLARVIVAVCLQVDCQANVWGLYHYCGVETKRESEFVQHLLTLAAQHDETVYQLLDRVSFNTVRTEPPEVANTTLSSKKIFDTFGIKQRSWHGSLQGVVKSIYGIRTADESAA